MQHYFTHFYGEEDKYLNTRFLFIGVVFGDGTEETTGWVDCHKSSLMSNQKGARSHWGDVLLEAGGGNWVVWYLGLGCSFGGMMTQLSLIGEHADEESFLVMRESMEATPWEMPF
eukprot:TRINITY_DN64122_c0_g2_i1.p2 TRINITY_DN64122_c0_g2~~TRINITY_DN64122_c0_g2_i1.p2  ORF type:complete len:115 (+),score=21.35 TRINITY_DN64122_c0_g2_i1:394-738(+)